MAQATSKPDVSSNLSKLTLEQPTRANRNVSKSKKAVADSWEDEDVDSGSDTPGTPGQQDDGSKAPPPTPISPTYQSADQQQWASMTDPYNSPPSSESSSSGDRRRPEKTDAVARRMIASALGVRAPRQTEEQKAYDRSVREQERKRLEVQKAEEARKREEAERAKAAVWND